MKRNEKGQTLVEVLVGLAAGVIVISAITVAVLSSLNNAEFSRDQNLATHYAEEGLEIMRNMRDQSISSLTSLPDGTYCLAKGCSSITNNGSDANCGPRPLGSIKCSQNVNNFVREVTITSNDSTCNGNGPTSAVTPTPQTTPTIKVSVSTYWADTKCTDTSNPFCHSVLLTSCLSDFTVVPTP